MCMFAEVKKERKKSNTERERGGKRENPYFSRDPLEDDSDERRTERGRDESDFVTCSGLRREFSFHKAGGGERPYRGAIFGV